MTELWRRILFLLRKRRFDRELDEEFQFHLEMKARESSQARREFGNPTLLKEISREAWGWSWIERLVQDLRYAARMLRKAPAFTAAAVLALAIGIGVNTTVFTFLNALLRPLPVREPDRLVSVRRKANGEAGWRAISLPDYRDLRDSKLFEDLAVFRQVSLTMGGLSRKSFAETEPAIGQYVSGNYFSTLGVHPILGRAITPDDDRIAGSGGPGGPVLVLTYGCWQARFGSDPAIIGKTLAVNYHPFTIVGVGPPDFIGTVIDPNDFWIPVATHPLVQPGPDRMHVRDENWINVIGRLREGRTMEGTQPDLAALSARLQREYPQANQKTTLVLEKAGSLYKLDSFSTPVVSLLLAATALVLLAACANIANLLLARAAARSREIAVRLALGAGRGRLIRQLLTESVVLALIGGAAGLLFSRWTSNLLLAEGIKFIPKEAGTFYLNIAPDLRVFGYAFALSCAAALIFGLFPALQASKAGISIALKQEPTGAATRVRSISASDVFVVLQTTICLVLLIASGLLTRGLWKALNTNPGFETKNVIDVEFDPGRLGFDERKTVDFGRQVAARLRAIPEVMFVAHSEVAPLVSRRLAPISTGSGKAVSGDYNRVTPEFFSALALPIVRGRNFTPQELASSAPVVLVTESTAARFWPGQDPLGKLLDVGSRAGMYRPSSEVIGVVRDSRNVKLWEVDPIYIYLPLWRDQRFTQPLLIRVNGDPRRLMAAVREEVHEIEPRMPVFIHTLEEAEGLQLLLFQGASGVVGFLGVIALVLAAIGLYGVLSYIVSRRTKEIGVRMALGADRRSVIGLILRRSFRLTIIGAAVGVVISALISRVLSVLLFGISPLDPLTFVGVCAFLLCVAMLASYLPARRAARIDPMEALRDE